MLCYIRKCARRCVKILTLELKGSNEHFKNTIAIKNYINQNFKKIYITLNANPCIGKARNAIINFEGILRNND